MGRNGEPGSVRMSKGAVQILEPNTYRIQLNSGTFTNGPSIGNHGLTMELFLKVPGAGDRSEFFEDDTNKAVEMGRTGAQTESIL